MTDNIEMAYFTDRCPVMVEVSRDTYVGCALQIGHEGPHTPPEPPKQTASEGPRSTPPDSVGEPEAEATTDVVRPAESTVLEESGATDEPPSPADTPTSPGSLCTAPNGPNETTVSDTLACRPLTTCEVREIVLTGPPRWGEKHAWIVQDGPPYYKQLAGPFSARRDALDALAEIVNDAGSTPGPSGRCREY